MSQYNMIMEMPESTVVAEYEPQTTRSGAYQSEAALEQAFIEMLTQQGYEYVQIHKADDLANNLRKQLEKLNHFAFTDSEWKRFSLRISQMQMHP